MPFLPLDLPARAGCLQLVATLGPASFSRVADLAAAGATAFRVNASHLDLIGSRVDAVWICRGDLGAQLGAAELARVVAAIEPARLPVPVLMAGQVLEHLTSHPEPTRSEVCHLFDLVAAFRH